MHAFVHDALTASYPSTPRPPLPPLYPIFCLPPTISHASALVGGPPYCTNDPANYVFKVFGSCENSFGSAVEGGRAVGEERGGEGGGDVGWSTGSWLSLLARLLCKHWIRAARVD